MISEEWHIHTNKRTKYSKANSGVISLDDYYLYIFPYGKYKGLPLLKVLDHDPSYINKCLKFNGLNCEYPLIDIAFPKVRMSYLYTDINPN